MLHEESAHVSRKSNSGDVELTAIARRPGGKDELTLRHRNSVEDPTYQVIPPESHSRNPE